MEWMIMPLRRYADFSGRSSRKEFWMFFLLNFIVGMVLWTFIILGAGASALADSSGTSSALFGGVGFLLLMVYGLAILIPTLAVYVRRFHDQDKSGWMILLLLVPFGGIIVLVFMCLEGTNGANRYGPDPRETYNANVFN